MNETDGPTSQVPLAFYDPESLCWRTSQTTLLEAGGERLETLPAWGTTRGGALYGRPTPERLIAGRESSPSHLIPTPDAGIFNDGQTIEAY